MSSQKKYSSVEDNVSDISDHDNHNGRYTVKPSMPSQEPTQPTITPRIKLKLQLNPPKLTTEHTDSADHKKKKKHKHKDHKLHKHHKKHKRKHNEEDSYSGHRRESEQLDIETDPTSHSRKRSISAVHPYDFDEREAKRPVYSEEDLVDDGNDSLFARTKAHKDVVIRNSEEPSSANQTIDHPSVYDESRRGSVASFQSVSTATGAESTPKSTSKSKKKTKQPRVWTPAKRDLKTICSRLLDTFIKRDAYGFFLEPVDTTIVTDYLTVIKKPMDFKTMRQKLESNQYPDMDAFKQDFQQICTNAKIYNAPDTPYWRNADKLEAYGLRAIEREGTRITYEPPAAIQQPQRPSSPERRKSMITIKQPQAPLSNISYVKRESFVKVEEDVDILGLDSTTSYQQQSALQLRKGGGRQGSAGYRESSMDVGSSRAITPNRTYTMTQKKKKKKISEAGVIFGPDGSLSAVHGVQDLSILVPHDKPFATLPPFSTINRAVLPSTFYTNRSMALTDDMVQDKYHIRPAFIWDYGAYPSLGVNLPSQFYTPQDLAHVFPVYGDDRGEAYMKSMWDFVGGMFGDEPDDSSARDSAVDTLCGYVNEKLQKLTRGAWDAVQLTMQPDPPLDGINTTVQTEFGVIDVPQAIKQSRLAVQRQKEPEELFKLISGKVDITELENLEPKAKADALSLGANLSESLDESAKLIAELLEEDDADDTKRNLLHAKLIEISKALPMTEAKMAEQSNNSPITTNTVATTSTA
ncbi:hypothetical protein BC943DRAFT_359507 [Umbelopsis sp. AD052]|nr:hypothetical protein BC943DRAFT_359507 [Umbelopsis sp. AD052]